jgi:hypothetical protein
MSLFASDYSPVSPTSTNPNPDLFNAQRPGFTTILGPDGEKHEEPVSNIDKLTGLPTPPRSPPNEATQLGRSGSDGSGSGSGSTSASASGSGSGSGSATVTSSKSSATMLELLADPLDKPYVAARKSTGYNSYEGCMEGESACASEHHAFVKLRIH